MWCRLGDHKWHHNMANTRFMLEKLGYTHVRARPRTRLMCLLLLFILRSLSARSVLHSDSSVTQMTKHIFRSHSPEKGNRHSSRFSRQPVSSFWRLSHQTSAGTLRIIRQCGGRTNRPTARPAGNKRRFAAPLPSILQQETNWRSTSDKGSQTVHDVCATNGAPSLWSRTTHPWPVWDTFGLNLKINLESPPKRSPATDNADKNLHSEWTGLQMWHPTSLSGALQTVGPRAATIKQAPARSVAMLTPSEDPQQQKFGYLSSQFVKQQLYHHIKEVFHYKHHKTQACTVS